MPDRNVTTTAPDGQDETAQRLAALARYDILDSPAEPGFDDIVNLATLVCQTPVALISLVAADRQWFKARVGFDACETPIGQSVCRHALTGPGLLVIPDLRADPRTRDNTLVTGEPFLRFYAGARLETQEGVPLGTLCVIDGTPRPGGLSDAQAAALSALARQVMAQMELRRSIADRDAALQGQRESAARHRQILESAHDYAIIAMDLDGCVTSWNRGAENVLGWTAPEIHGRPVHALFVEEDVSAGIPEREMRAAREAGRGNDERWHRRKDGSRFWATGEMMPLTADDGHHIGYLKILRERTEVRLREQRLALLSQASAGLLVATDPNEVLGPVLAAGAEPLGFDQSYNYIVTPDGGHLQLSHAFGVPEADEPGQPPVRFDEVVCGIVAETRMPLVIEHLETTTEPRLAPGRAAGLRTYAGFPIIIRNTLYGVISFGSTSRAAFDQEALSFLATFALYLAVVRERLDREARLRDLNANLESRVEERTRALLAAEEALRQSQKLEAVGQLTGGVAHDFNNLLTIIRSSVDFLRRPNLPEARRARYMDAVSDTVDRAAKLTGQLLAFARRQALTPEVFEVGACLRGVADMVDTVTGARIRVVTEVPDRPCYVRADLSQFETALVNVAVNARDAMDGAGTLTLRLVCSEGMPPIRGHAGTSVPFAAVSMTDTGSGIAPDLVGRIFEPFYTTKPVGQGTGLGLSQVFGFAKQSGGDVAVESVPGEGTTFTLYLPEIEPDPDPERQAPEEDPGPSPDGAGRCVLVVEDNLEVGRFSTQILQDLGYKTVWAPNAEEALQELEKIPFRFDVIFTDVVMPGMGGIELAKEVRRRHIDLPVILTSGYSHVLAQEGGHGFELLQKPYSAEQLSRVLRRVTQRRRQRRQS